MKRPKRGKLLEAACPTQKVEKLLEAACPTQKVEKLLEAARPEGAEALSPGQRPGLFCSVSLSPCKGKSFITRGNLQSFCPYRAPCRLALNPGHCPGLRASALSGRAACVHNTPGLGASALYLCFTLRPAIFNSATRR